MACCIADIAIITFTKSLAGARFYQNIPNYMRFYLAIENHGNSSEGNVSIAYKEAGPNFEVEFVFADANLRSPGRSNGLAGSIPAMKPRFSTKEKEVLHSGLCIR